MIVSKFISAVTDGLRTLTVSVFGLPRTPAECAPSGYDGNPIAGMKAIYGDTVTNGQDVIVGYINPAQIAEVGAVRLYAQDESGAEKVHIWLHADGTLELGGTGPAGSNVNHAAQWEALKTQLDLFLAAQKLAIAASFTALGGTYPITPFPDLDLTTAKLTKIKVE